MGSNEGGVAESAPLLTKFFFPISKLFDTLYFFLCKEVWLALKPGVSRAKTFRKILSRRDVVYFSENVSNTKKMDPKALGNNKVYV